MADADLLVIGAGPYTCSAAAICWRPTMRIAVAEMLR